MPVGPTWSLSDDRQRIRAVFPTKPHPSALELEAPEVDDLIERLMEARAAMLPEVPMVEPDPGTRVKTAASGRWYVQPRATDLVLAILHPGARWVGLVLDRFAAGELARTLRKHAR